MRRWLLPEHIEDVLPAEARAIERLRRSILDLFEAHGYELVAPPLLEYLESLLSGTGRDLDLATFKLTDRLSGRLMGIRAVQQKDASAAKEIAGAGSEAADALAALTTMNGGLDVIERARGALPGNRIIGAALDVLAELAARCAETGVEVSVDLAELGGFN